MGFWAGALVLAVAILWKFPQWQVRPVRGLNAKERFDRENDARKTLAQILGGFLLLSGIFGSFLSLQLTRYAQESARLAQEGQIAERFTKAIEQLGAVDASGKKKLEVRLGGIYALERIANDSKRDHWPIMEVLCTYVRENAPRKPQESAQKNQAVNPLVPPADIQAILTVLGRRDTEYERGKQVLDLSNTNIHGADLRAADLRGADLHRADVRDAVLSDADLSDTVLYWTDLRGAHLRGAHLRAANLRVADLGGADFSGANLGVADLSGATLGRAVLRGAVIFHANFSGADFRGANLSGADLRFALNLTQQQIDVAEGDPNTRLPDNLHKPEGWKKWPGTAAHENDNRHQVRPP